MYGGSQYLYPAVSYETRERGHGLGRISREINPQVGRLIRGSEDESVIRETTPETRPRLGRASSGCVRTREGSVGLDKVDDH